jgi:hypothetical protein
VELGGAQRKRRATSNASRIICSKKHRNNAPELVHAIYKAPSALLTFPHCGRPGKKENTREVVLSPLHYIVVYRILACEPLPQAHGLLDTLGRAFAVPTLPLPIESKAFGMPGDHSLVLDDE